MSRERWKRMMTGKGLSEGGDGLGKCGKIPQDTRIRH